MFESSRIELSRDSLRQNLKFIKGLLPQGCRMSSVIKGNAYGHGIELFVPMAHECGVNHFSTFSADEAWQVKSCLDDQATVMVMGDVDGAALEWAIENGVEFWLFNPSRIEEALKFAKKTGKRAKVHLEIETGMNRNGLTNGELPHVLELIMNNFDQIEIKGICSHLAGAESISNHYRIERQRSNFDEALARIAACGIHGVSKHLACSAAVIRYPETCFDLARVGIMQYGFFPTREIRIEYTSRNPEDINPLQRIITWKSRIMSTYPVKRGEFVGYGTSYQAMDDLLVATVPVGYCHGFSRSLSNLGTVLVRGQKAPVLGVVNMNLISVNVTHIEGLEIGSEVVLIGTQGDEEITVSSFSDVSSQVNYELLTRLPASIPREVI